MQNLDQSFFAFFWAAEYTSADEIVTFKPDQAANALKVLESLLKLQQKQQNKEEESTPPEVDVEDNPEDILAQSRVKGKLFLKWEPPIWV